MTRPSPRRLLALALAAALAAPAWAQSFEPFRVSDIRVDGLQRISAGTVFTYLPIERGDTIDSAKAAQGIRSLYKTGFFSDVRMERQGDILVVNVQERPAINKITVTGNKDIKDDDFKKVLKDIGMTEGETFDPMSLDRMTQELTRQYNNRGKYNVKVTPKVTRLDRNRVDVEMAINEGTAAKIRHINIIGNEVFTNKQLTKDWESRTSNWLSWYSKDDQYSREKLSGDLEKLQSYYLDRGYIDADVSEDNTQVSISPDKRDMFITSGITEGEQYRLSGVTVSGNPVLSQASAQKHFEAFLHKDAVFSRALLEMATESYVAQLSNVGYAFAQVNPVPAVDREHHTVALDLQVNPGPRVNVRRIVFKGNTRTADPVLRRQMRQMEGSWYSQAAIDRSKVRLQQLGYFEEVNIESKPVPGTSDQVDLAVTVKETNSGTVSFGVGYSQLGGIQLNGNLSERNFLGSGNQVTIALGRNMYEKQINFSFLNPYFTKNGMSLGYNILWSDYNYANANIASYSASNGAMQVVMGLPITEWDTVTWMGGFDRKRLSITPGITPQPIVDYINAVGKMTFHAWRTRLAYSRDTRNDYLQPSRGTFQQLALEATLPGSTAKYYTLDYQLSHYWMLTPALVLNAVGNVGYGNSYGSYKTVTLPDGRIVTSKGLPFFENFYAGGVSSTGRVRGFVDNTLGPEAAGYGGYPQPLGGSLKTVGSLEMFFPKLIDTKAARFSAFVDVGNVWAGTSAFQASQLRVSSGIALMWRSPMGPISISYAIPLRYQRNNTALGIRGDQTERLQFTFAGQF